MSIRGPATTVLVTLSLMLQMLSFVPSKEGLAGDSTSLQSNQVPAYSHTQDLATSGFFANDEARQAWRRFVADGKYRMAEPGDFTISKEFLGNPDLRHVMAWPVEGGDINHDGAFNDFAVIVVDTTRAGPDRFGIAIFNEPKSRRGRYVQYWLYRNWDLSKASLTWSSDGLGVLWWDGIHRGCVVRWDSRRRAYFCR